MHNFAEMQRGKFVHNFRLVFILYQDQKNKDDIRAAQLAQSKPNCPLMKQPLTLLISTSKASYFVLKVSSFVIPQDVINIKVTRCRSAFSSLLGVVVLMTSIHVKSKSSLSHSVVSFIE